MVINFYVLAFLCLGNQVLLVQRCHEAFGKGLYSMVGGKVEQGETAQEAIKREVHEEITLDIPQSAFQLAHTYHRVAREGEIEVIILCFKVDLTDMTAPYNNEPDKHDDMRFFSIDQLPKNIIGAHKQIIGEMRRGRIYSEAYHGPKGY